MGIASLGRHRNGITRIKTLKNREYAARGIPFVYSENDSDFDGMPYVMKAPGRRYAARHRGPRPLLRRREPHSGADPRVGRRHPLVGQTDETGINRTFRSMTTIAILFWAGVFLVFYTYLGYGILLWTLVKIREALRPARRHEVPVEAPEVTLLIAAYNEQEIVAEKMANCRALEYPAGKLRITWITDGSTDRTVEPAGGLPRRDRSARRTARRQDRGAEPRAGTHPHAARGLHRRQHDAQSRSRDGDRPLFRGPAGRVRGGREARGRRRRTGSRRHRRRLLEIRIETQGAGLPALFGRRSRGRTVRRAARTVADTARRHAARRFRLLDADRGAGLQNRLLQGGVRAGDTLGRHGRGGQAQETHRGPAACSRSGGCANCSIRSATACSGSSTSRTGCCAGR